jgi:hypothetical protein
MQVVSVRVSSGVPWQELVDDGVDIAPDDTDLAPLLVVFSNDRNRRQSAERDLREMLHHEMDLDPELLDDDYDDYDEEEEEGGDGGDDVKGYVVGHRGNGAGDGGEGGYGDGDGGGHDKVRVVDDVKDYEDEEVSEAAYDSLETGTGYSQQTSTDINDITGEESANQVHGHKLSRRSVANDKPQGVNITRHQSEHHVSRRSTRPAPRPPRKSRRRRNSCRRKALYVRFSDLNWHNWIIAPEGYMVSVP